MADTSTIDRTSTHYKGKFATIYEVNRKYPNGGAEGDYVEIDGWAHYWNADRGTWTVNAERDTYWDEKWSGISETAKTLQDYLETETKNRTEADARLLALEQSEWPLQLTLTATPELLEYTGEAQTVTLGWTVKRRNINVTPTALSLRVGVQAMQVIEGAKTATISVKAEGNTSITLHVEAEGMTDETTKTVTMVRAMYFGFAAAEAATDLDIKALGKQPIKTTPGGSYTISNAADGNYLWLCVPDTMNISKVTSGGFDVPMEAVETTDGYKCYRSSNAIVTGTYNYQIA